MVVRYVVVLVLFGLILGGLNAYVHGRVAWLFRIGQRGRRVLAGVLVAPVVLVGAARLLSGRAPDVVLAPIAVLGFTVGVAAVLAAFLVGLVDLARLVAGIPQRLRQAGEIAAPVPVGALPMPLAEAPIEEPSGLTRRVFLVQAATGSALVAGAGSSLYGSFFGRHDYVIEEITVPIPGLSPRLDGYTIVQLSDVHLGMFVGEPELRSAEELIRRARPDLIVLTGDLIDHEIRFADALAQFTRRIGALARDGVAAVPGNHDYYAGVDRTLAALTSGGATVLRNTGRVVGDAGGAFALLGVDDPWGLTLRTATGPNLQQALEAVPRDLPRILLCHNPAYFPKAAGEVALQLSGHTHGGQIKLVVSPADVILPHGYVRGLYQRGGARLYVNRGFGTVGPPARIGSAPEITRIVLTAA